jgi:hypothetical protein
MIGDFIIGNQTTKVVVRAIGPSLGAFGVPTPLANPMLELRDINGTLLDSNNDWKTKDSDGTTQQGAIEATGLAPSDDREAAIIATLAPGQYTGLLTNKLGAPGIGTFELYDLNFSADSELANISTRGIVLNGNNVMIAGFTLGNSIAPTNLAVRARGPSLSNFFGNVLADPTLELRDANGFLITSNDDWQDDPVSAALLTANGLGLSDPKESGLFLSAIAPGQYTAIVAGKNGGTGIALVELYNVK